MVLQKVKYGDKEYDLEPKDAVLIIVLKDLVKAINKLVVKI